MFKDEKNIILELKKGNEKAFNIIYHEYYKLIFYIIYNMVYDYELANDLTTDTFIQMYKKIELHNINKSFKYWLVTIAKNLTKNYLKTNIKINKLIINEDLVDESPDNNNELSSLLNECKKLLTPLEFDILNYHIIFNMTYVDISLICNISKSEAHRIYKKAIAKLQAGL